MGSLVEKLKPMACEVIDSEDNFVVSTDLKGKSKYIVYVDGKAGVTVDKCAKWNHALREKMEQSHEVEWSSGDFELEVSSFGVGKALEDHRQFLLNIGRTVEVHIEEEGTLVTYEGKLSEVTDSHITLAIKGTGKTKHLVHTKAIDKKQLKHIHVEVTF